LSGFGPTRMAKGKRGQQTRINPEMWMMRTSIDNGLPIIRCQGSRMSRKTNAYMGDMDILWPELLCQALRKSPHPKLTRSKSAGYNVAPKSCRGTCEDEGASLSSCFLKLLVIFERENGTTREREGGGDGRLEEILDVLRCDFEEGLPNTMSNVEHGRTDGVFRFGEM